MKRAALFLAALFFGFAPAPKPTDPATLVGHVGRQARGFIVVPTRGSTVTVPTEGKPTVIVLFASWCAACVSEMPMIVADATAFSDAVNFIGIDYDEAAESAVAFIEKNRITFPTEVFDAGISTPNGPERPLIVHVPGGRLTSEALEAFRENVSPQTYQALVQIAQAQESQNSDIEALERRLGVQIEDIGSLSNETADSFALPHAFVIDGAGILRDDLTGYEPHADRIRAALQRLGVPENIRH